MKFFLLVLLCCGAHLSEAQVKDYQVKDNSRSKQVEQLQQLKQTIDRSVDTLQVQLPQLAVQLQNSRKKIEQLKKESSIHQKAEPGSKEQTSKLSYELACAINQGDSLRKKFDMQLNTLDKSLTLQKDLEDKISTLIKENNR